MLGYIVKLLQRRLDKVPIMHMFVIFFRYGVQDILLQVEKDVYVRRYRRN